MNALFILLTAILIAACTKPSKEEPPSADTLRMKIATEPPTLDWQRADDVVSDLILENVMEGLVRYDFSGGGIVPKLVPALATSWKWLVPGLRLQVDLRRDAKWSDGVPFTAQQVVDAWRRTLTKENAAPYVRFLASIKNASAFYDGKAGWEKVGVKSPDPYRIVIELEKPMMYFPLLLAHFSTYPIRLDIIEKFPQSWTEPAHAVYLGPFRIKTWQHEKQLELERNPAYHSPKPGVQHVLIYVINEWVTASNLFKTGKLDFADGVASTEVAALEKTPEFHTVPRLAASYLAFNVTKPPVDRPEVRKAIGLAINRDEVLGILAGGRTPLRAVPPHGLLENSEVAAEFDPEAARALLGKAGYSTEHPLKLTYIFANNEDARRVAENIQGQLKRNLGVDVEVMAQEFKQLINTFKTDPPPIFPFGWVADYPDPSVHFGLFTSASANNYTRWKNARYDQLVALGNSATTSNQRRDRYREAQDLILRQERVLIPLFNGVVQYLQSPRVEGLFVNPRGLVELNGVRVL
jgi:oligopeptide transport system substrate-binding protein